MLAVLLGVAGVWGGAVVVEGLVVFVVEAMFCADTEGVVKALYARNNSV